MIMCNWKLFLKYLSVFLVLVLGIVFINRHINNVISKQTQEMQEKNAKRVADIQLKCETEKLDESTELKKEISDLKIELEKSKILIERIQKRGKVTEEIKKDVKGFIKKFDDLVGTKGKTNEK